MEATIMENQIEKTMKNDMETVVIEAQNTTFLVLQTPQRGPRFPVGSGIGSCARPWDISQSARKHDTACHHKHYYFGHVVRD